MWGSMSYSMWKLHNKPALLALLLLIGVGVTVYLTRFVPTMAVDRQR